MSISCQNRYTVIGGLSYLVYIFHIVNIAMLTISYRHRYPIIPHLHRRHRDVDDIVSTLCQHRYPVCLCLSYLIYIVHIINIAMWTISCPYRVDIGSLTYLVYIVYIAMLTISSRYRVDIGTQPYLVTSLTSSTSQC